METNAEDLCSEEGAISQRAINTQQGHLESVLPCFVWHPLDLCSDLSRGWAS